MLPDKAVHISVFYPQLDGSPAGYRSCANDAYKIKLVLTYAIDTF